MPKNPAEMAAAMKANLVEKTGKSLAQWLKVAKASGAEKHGVLVKHLKAEHGVTHGYANLIAHEHFSSAAHEKGDDDLVAGQYAGAKAGLLPIYEALRKAIERLGGDVEVAPKKTYVSFRRSKQFALVQPSTRTRIDVGLKLPGVEPTDRLEDSGKFNSMVTHRVRVESARDVDAELKRWLKQAYAGA